MNTLITLCGVAGACAAIAAGFAAGVESATHNKRAGRVAIGFVAVALGFVLAVLVLWITKSAVNY